MKTITYHYNDNEIQFSVDPNDKNLMVNATEMAKVFNKEVNEFTSNQSTKNFIIGCLKTGNSRFINIVNESDLIVSKQKSGTWMHQVLALKFAAWLNSDFELWVFSTINEIVFGNYKKHWDAHAAQEQAKLKMENIKKKMIENPTKELVLDYFNAELAVKEARKQKTAAIKNQLRLFEHQAEDFE
jgi:hypothetical protein